MGFNLWESVEWYFNWRSFLIGIQMYKWSWSFYNTYAKEIKFSIRKEDLKLDKNEDIISRKYVCSKEGHQLSKCLQKENHQRELRTLTRVGWEVAFHIGFSRKLEKWIVKEFKEDHNHPLVDAIDTQFL